MQTPKQTGFDPRVPKRLQQPLSKCDSSSSWLSSSSNQCFWLSRTRAGCSSQMLFISNSSFSNLGTVNKR